MQSQTAPQFSIITKSDVQPLSRGADHPVEQLLSDSHRFGGDSIKGVETEQVLRYRRHFFDRQSRPEDLLKVVDHIQHARCHRMVHDRTMQSRLHRNPVTGLQTGDGYSQKQCENHITSAGRESLTECALAHDRRRLR